MSDPLAGTGIWSAPLRYGDPVQAADRAAELEELGYSAIWLPDVGGDLFGAVENLVAATDTLTIATGILNIWLHEPADAADAVADLVAEHGRRLLLGLGVSHRLFIDLQGEGTYRRPLAKMAEFLDGLDAAPRPVPVKERVLAALGPQMLELARARTAGSHLYLVAPEHTATARAALGPDRLVAPEQAVVLESDASQARAIARTFLATYLELANYRNSWKRIGLTDDDLLGGGSDRLVDRLVVWGDEETIAARVREHRAAGADHVCIQVLTAEPLDPSAEGWRRLAPAVIG